MRIRSFFRVGLLAAVWVSEGFALSTRAQLQQEWAAHYPGPGTVTTDANRLALDGSGGVYMAGTDSNVRYLLVRYDRNGRQLWAVHYVGPGGTSYTYDVLSGLAVDASGNACVTGSSLGRTGAYDCATIKYDGEGHPLWVHRFDGPVHANDGGADLALDESGQVYVTGSSTGFGSALDYATFKLSAAGDPLWVARYTGPGTQDDSPVDVVVDASGCVYVTGNSLGTGVGTDYVTIKYDASGKELWVARYNGPDNYYDTATKLAVDNRGYVYVTGYSYRFASMTDYTTIKYNTNGAVLWVARYNGPGNRGDYAIDLAVDNSGNVYVSGDSWGLGSAFSDYATIKYDPDGREIWVARYNGPGNSYDSASALALDDAGHCFVTGSSEGPGSPYDIATIQYDPNGQPLWLARFDAPGKTNDSPTSLVLDSAGNVMVCGISAGYRPGYDYLTLKYALATRLESCRRLPNSEVQFQLTGEPGRVYEIQSSSNLAVWDPLETVTNISGEILCRDPSASGAAQRFYQAFKQP